MRKRTLTVGIGVLVAAVGATALLVTVRPAQAAAYVTATASSGTVQQTLTTSGTVTRPGRHDLTFDTAGTVTGVHVRVGDQVTQGQRIATIDPAPLQVSLLQAQAQLAQAKATLAADETAKKNGTSSAGLSLPATTPAATQSAEPTATPTATATPTTPDYLLALQTSMAGLQQAAAAQQTACAPVYALLSQVEGLQDLLPDTSAQPSLSTPDLAAAATASSEVDATPDTFGHRPGTPSASASPGATPTSSAGATASPAPSATPSVTATPQPTPTALPSVGVEEAQELAQQVVACVGAMTALATAQQAAGQAIVTASTSMEAATAAAQAQLAAAQESMAVAAQAAAQQAAAQAMAEAQAQLAEQAQRAYGSTVTEATLAADRAKVLQAEQQVARAQRSLDGAVLSSPIDGTVGAVGLVAGEGSTGRSVTVIGDGGAEVTIQVPLSIRSLVTTGLPARVGLVGTDPQLTGRVSSVSVLPASTSGTPSYETVVVVEDPSLVLKPGSKAELALPLRTASDVVTVPLSAVTKTTDTTGTVEVVTDPRATRSEVVPVTTGTVGGGRIEIVSGLSAGQLVVLADRREPVPGGLAQYEAVAGR